jgi:hypothetical protein
MSRHRLAVPAALAVVALAAPAAAHADTTLTFKEVDKGSSFHVIDNPPKGTRTHHLSPGDQFVIQNPLAGKAGKRIGTLRATCSMTTSKDSICYGVFSFANGTLDALVALPNTEKSTKTTGGIIGGTGVYAGARGSFVSKDTKTGGDDTVTLLG